MIFGSIYASNYPSLSRALKFFISTGQLINLYFLSFLKKESDTYNVNNPGPSSLISNDNFSMNHLEEGEVVSLNYQCNRGSQKSTLNAVGCDNSAAVTSKPADLSERQQANSDRIKRHFRRTNVPRTAQEKTNDQIVYTLDCEVVSGHDNCGAQTPHVPESRGDKSVRLRKTKLSANSNTLESKFVCAQASCSSANPKDGKADFFYYYSINQIDMCRISLNQILRS